MSKIKPTDWKFVPKAKLTQIPDKGGFYQLYRDMYWAVTENDELIFYRKYGLSPQCNSQQSITQAISNKEWHPGTHVEKIDAVWVPHECRDYV